MPLELVFSKLKTMPHPSSILTRYWPIALIAILHAPLVRAGEFQTDSLQVKLPKAWADRAKIKVVPANPLYTSAEAAALKADPRMMKKGSYENMPEHVQIHLSAIFPDSWHPEITLQSVDECSRILDPEGHPYQGTKQAVDELWTIATKPAAYHKGEELPFFGNLDASQSIAVGLKSIPFAGGLGIRYLTQYDVEPSLLFDGSLMYIYEGLTKDRKYLVSATFPLHLEGLATEKTKAHLGFSMEQGHYGELEKNIRVYREKATAWLNERLDQITPSLKQLDEIMASLEVTEPQR